VKLSIVIVNFNVANYLEQCLISVEKAIQDIDCEIFVVDNNSVDGSCKMIRRLFPTVILIENNSNLGFAKANNQAIRKATGEFILLLNPDTVVEKGTFRKAIEYISSQADFGGLGVKMIDGNGLFLPESKRGFPSPKVAFYKLSGLATLFPHSKTFNKYHLGYLNNEEINEVDVLSGAFMLIRKNVLDEIGLLDETYFMYGEDIDLSYRIVNAGYKNIYFPKTTIIHYKGQSTQKGSLNYVILFYTAMKIFAQKFFSKTHARTFLFFLNIAIYFRAGISLARRIFAKSLYPILDFITVYTGFALFSPAWGKFRYQNSNYDFPAFYYDVNLPIYSIILVLTLYLSKTYIRPISIKKTFESISIAMLINLIIFALLPYEFRFSRAMFIVGIVWTFIFIPIVRFLLHFIDKQDFAIHLKHKRRTIIIGNEDECNRVSNLMKESNKNDSIIGFVSPYADDNQYFIGNLNQLSTIIKIHKIEDIIFCERDIPEHVIIKEMILISTKNVECKIAPQHSLFIVGNNSTNSVSKVYTVNINSIALERNYVAKRIFDIILSLMILLFTPLLSFYFGSKTANLCKNCLKVIRSQKTWIGYNSICNFDDLILPKLKPCIISIVNRNEIDLDKTKEINIMYAKNYSVFNDLIIVFKNFNLVCS